MSPLLQVKMKLALSLGKTLFELDQAMPWPELKLWLKYDEEFGIPDPWLQTGMICQVIANTFGDGKHPCVPTDFMPVLKKPKKATKESIQHFRATMALLKAKKPDPKPPNSGDSPDR